MTEQELVELCSLGETTTVQFKLEFTTPKQIAEELVAFANTHGGVIVFGAEDKTGKMVGLTYEQLQYTSRELGNTANDHVRPVIYIETETLKHEGRAYLLAYVKRPYRGLGSGIPRVMAENCDVELIDHPDGNQFVARIWRTTQKKENTTQKANEELISTTQKEESTTQKSKNATQKPLTTTQKAILIYLKEHPEATRQEVTEAIGNITEDGVKFNIGRLQQYGLLKRIGSKKKGQWIVTNVFVSENDSENTDNNLFVSENDGQNDSQNDSQNEN